MDDGTVWDSVPALGRTDLPRAVFEPNARFETDDLEAQIALIESGNAVAILPDLMRVRRRPDVRVVDVDPRRRTVFTATRTALARSPAIRDCRDAPASVAPAELTVPLFCAGAP